MSTINEFRNTRKLDRYQGEKEIRQGKGGGSTANSKRNLTTRRTFKAMGECGGGGGWGVITNKGVLGTGKLGDIEITTNKYIRKRDRPTMGPDTYW